MFRTLSHVASYDTDIDLDIDISLQSCIILYDTFQQAIVELFHYRVHEGVALLCVVGAWNKSNNKTIDIQGFSPTAVDYGMSV